MAFRELCRSLRAQAAPAAKTALLRSGGYTLLRRVRPSRRLAILRYHAICDPCMVSYADPAICVSPEAFERHVRCLTSRYRVVSLPEAAAALRQNRPLPENAVAITFDDGYADNLAAARTLARYGATATFYVTAGCLGGEAPFWPAEIRQLLAAVTVPALVVTVGGARVEMAIGTIEERKAAVRRLTRLFKSQPIDVRERLRDELRRQTGDWYQAGVMLTWEQVAEMHRLNMTIGAHTLTHPNLPSAGLQAAILEIVGSKQRLDHEMGVETTMFSYPNGGAEEYYTTELQRVVAWAGFQAAASSRNGFAGPGSDLYALERIQVAERLENLLFALEVERFAFRPR